jgi:hypothetical protein
MGISSSFGKGIGGEEGDEEEAPAKRKYTPTMKR